VHRDADPDLPGATRMINYVYYFHKTPRPYTGGELLLFDSDTEVKDSWTRSRFTCVAPEDNSVVFFPPNFYHSVAPIRCPTQDFADSRFVINGHYHKSEPAAAQA
jgi:Rps23 Pro-64 3,4-dihydroxylase Tpa1-like proline 4-hydroxylase